MKTQRLQAQISAIQKNIATGKAKNIFAAKTKIYKLTKELASVKLFQYLAK